MTDKEIDRLLIEMEEYRIKLSNDPEASKQFLIDAGIINEQGQLTEPYQNLYIPE